TTVPNDCGTSSKTWAQAYLYAVDQMQGGPQGGAVAVGSDVMGVIATAAPRFNGDPFSHACNQERLADQGAGIAYPLQIHNQPGHLGPMQIGEREFDFNTDGFAQIGLYPEFIADLKAIGLTDTDLAPLFNSAEAYVRMWEKAENVPPVAQSQNVTVAAGPTCTAPASINNGSVYPEGGALSSTPPPPGPSRR